MMRTAERRERPWFTRRWEKCCEKEGEEGGDEPLAGEECGGEEKGGADGGDAGGEAIHVVEEVEGVGDDEDPENGEGDGGPVTGRSVDVEESEKTGVGGED